MTRELCSCIRYRTIRPLELCKRIVQDNAVLTYLVYCIEHWTQLLRIDGVNVQIYILNI
jgi:hypothetical protein